MDEDKINLIRFIVSEALALIGVIMVSIAFGKVGLAIGGLFLFIIGYRIYKDLEK